MALTNAQYESIIREYEEKLNTSRHALEKRKQEIYDSIPEYAALENNAAELSVEYTRKIIDGVPGARQQLSTAISEISEKVGFPDYNYFSRVFKKYKAVTPTKFRKSLSDSRDIRA